MDTVIGFILGLFTGGMLGLFIGAVLSISQDNKNNNFNNERRQ